MKKNALIILDGWGYGKRDSSDAIFNANTPFFDQLINKYPNATLRTDGENVGLPKGQMGNSEVGHLNIGAGRIVYQDLVKINLAMKNNEIDSNHVWQEITEKAKQKTLHIIGLVSDGGVHSHMNHLAALCRKASAAGCDKIFVHAFTDGRDTDPKSGKSFLLDLDNAIDGKAKIASVIGRYFAMDRDLRWERIAKVYNLLTKAEGKEYSSLEELFDSSYENNITDEFIEASVLDKAGIIKEGDVVLCANFRTDRCREITRALAIEDFSEYGMAKLNIEYYTMTRYDETFKNVKVLFSKDNLKNTLGEVLSYQNATQLRMAETEKYPHVTFFFSGGREEEFKGEMRKVVASPKVATYDLQPEMSAPELANEACDLLETKQPNFLCLNFANPDMVGHTGVYSAIVKAVETTDACLKQVVEKGKELGYSFIIIADHGNADKAVNEDGSPNTAHTLNEVPVIVVSESSENLKLNNGILADVAPTVLQLLQLKQPQEMSGKSLIV